MICIKEGKEREIASFGAYKSSKIIFEISKQELKAHHYYCYHVECWLIHSLQSHGLSE
jgi:hypothetical protein